MGFLTVEDINTINYKYQQFFYWLIDTALISSDADYEDAEYDMCYVTKTTEDNNYVYSFNITANRWTKGFYVLDKNGDYQNVSYSFTDGKLVITTAKTDNFKAIKLFIYCGVTPFNSVTLLKYRLSDDEVNLNLKELAENQNVDYTVIATGEVETDTFSLNKGYNLLENDNDVVIGYLKVNLIKSDFQFNCNQTLTVGKINTVRLGADNDYKPDGAMVGDEAPQINVVYENKVLPVTFDEILNDYVFDLDLTDKSDAGKVKFKVVVESDDAVNYGETTVILTSDYETVNTINALKSACKSGGSDIIRLGANLTATSIISVKHPIKIIGNNHTINLNGYGFNLINGVNFNAENLQLNNGNTAIKQATNTKVELNNCKFTNCYATETNNLGSCILCDTTYDSLSIEDDFITTLNNCTFTNNHSTILSGGELNIDNCKFHNTNIEMVDKNNPAFIYQTDGDATITNSIFDIDYTSNDLCSNEKNIGFAQCIFICGETATINNVGYSDLKNNNIVFCGTPANNRSHIFAKYYYPQIETCVYSSPALNYEDQALCYGLSGDDWIYKYNVQVTRASWGTENTNRKIIWEE